MDEGLSKSIESSPGRCDEWPMFGRPWRRAASTAMANFRTTRGKGLEVAACSALLQRSTGPGLLKPGRGD